MTETFCVTTGALGVMLLGLSGSFLPLIPGVPLVWLGATGYGILDGFEHLSWPAFGALTLLGAVGTTAELWATQIGTRAGGASGRAGLVGSCLGALAMLFFSLPIALLAALAGVFGVEWLRSSRTSGWQGGDARRAAQGSGGWLAGWVLSAAAQFSVSLFMILFFLWSILF